MEPSEPRPRGVAAPLDLLPSALGAVAVGAFVLTLWYLSTGVHGRLAYLFVAERTTSLAWIAIGAAAAALVTGGLAAKRRGGSTELDAVPGEPGPRFAWVLRLSVTLLVLSFLADLLAADASGADPAALYDVLRGRLGAPVRLVVTGAGLVAVAMFVAAGGRRLFGRVLAQKPRVDLVVTWALRAVAVAFLVFSLNVLSYFMVGRTFVEGGAEGAASETPPAEDGAAPPEGQAP
ncbi:MAG: hypothetical protein R3A78_13030 [Polyangiales bacterium]|nr:hypothetical protein [Myxococcales bacterium]